MSNVNQSTKKVVHKSHSFWKVLLYFIGGLLLGFWLGIKYQYSLDSEISISKLDCVKNQLAIKEVWNATAAHQIADLKEQLETCTSQINTAKDTSKHTMLGSSCPD